MDHDFERCNSHIFFDGYSYRYASSKEIILRQEKYKQAGFIVDISNDLFVRPNYGALAYICGKCDNINEVMRMAYEFNNFYDFPSKLKEGYKFVIGPGLHYKNCDGIKIFSDYGVYCTNYLDIINKQFKHGI